MRIFLTGATGFLGLHVLPLLLARSHVVAVLVRPGKPKECLQKYKHKIKIIYGCLEQHNTYNSEFIRFSPEAVIHLAWWGVDNKSHYSIEQLDNLQSSLDLLKLAHQVGVKHWVALGSQAEYGTHNQAIVETASTLPTSTYGAIKLATMLATKELAECFGMRFVWLRLFSCYGPGDDGDWFIPFIIRALLAKSIPDMTAGEQVWDYLYITDVAEAVCEVLQTPDAKGVFNLGSAQPRTIRYVAESLRDLIDPSIKLNLGAVPYKKNQIMHMEADIKHITSETKWEPKKLFEEGLIETVEWFRER